MAAPKDRLIHPSTITNPTLQVR